MLNKYGETIKRATRQTRGKPVQVPELNTKREQRKRARKEKDDEEVIDVDDEQEVCYNVMKYVHITFNISFRKSLKRVQAGRKLQQRRRDSGRVSIRSYRKN